MTGTAGASPGLTASRVLVVVLVVSTCWKMTLSYGNVELQQQLKKIICSEMSNLMKVKKNITVQDIVQTFAHQKLH